MTRLLLDTHAWVWSMFDDPRLSARARVAIENASELFISPVSLFEIAQKVRLGKWPVMEPHVEGLVERLVADGAALVTLTGRISLLAGSLDWDHRDPFDRMIAATALVGRCGLVSADGVFDGVPGGVRRVW